VVEILEVANKKNVVVVVDKKVETVKVETVKVETVKVEMVKVEMGKADEAINRILC
jgi:hypothetical protein